MLSQPTDDVVHQWAKFFSEPKVRYVEIFLLLFNDQQTREDFKTKFEKLYSEMPTTASRGGFFIKMMKQYEIPFSSLDGVLQDKIMQTKGKNKLEKRLNDNSKRLSYFDVMYFATGQWDIDKRRDKRKKAKKRLLRV